MKSSAYAELYFNRRNFRGFQKVMESTLKYFDPSIAIEEQIFNGVNIQFMY